MPHKNNGNNCYFYFLQFYCTEREEDCPEHKPKKLQEGKDTVCVPPEPIVAPTSKEKPMPLGMIVGGAGGGLVLVIVGELESRLLHHRA